MSQRLMPASIAPPATRIASQRLRLAGQILTILGLASLLIHQVNVMRWPSDFTQDYVAALALRAGQSIYADPSGYLLALFGPTSGRPSMFENFHPPFAAVLFLPLTALPYPIAALCWNALSLLLYLGCGWLLLRELELRSAAPSAWLLTGLALCWYPFQAHMVLGQISLLIVACLLGAWALLRRRRDAWAGLLLGLAVLIKMFPALFGFYLLLTRRWTALISMALTIVAGYGLLLALVGWQDIATYHQSVVERNVASYGAALINVSLAGPLYRLLTDGPWVEPLVEAPWLARLALGLLALPVLGAIAAVARHPGEPVRRDLGFAITAVGALLLSPLTWQHSFPLLWLPLALLWRCQPADRSRRRRWLIAWFVALGLISLPDIEIARALMAWSRPYRLPWYAALPLLAPTLGLVWIGGWCLWQSRRHPARHASEGPGESAAQL